MKSMNCTSIFDISSSGAKICFSTYNNNYVWLFFCVFLLKILVFINMPCLFSGQLNINNEN